MKTLKINFIALFFLLGLSSTYAQIDPSAFGYYSDALRFSRITKGGSVRFQTLGGAVTALGGDISNAHTNPAGLGFNRSSQFSITPTINLNQAQSTVFGTTVDDNRLNVNFDQAGILFSNAKNTSGPNKGGSFAITVTRVNDFQSNLSYRGVNNENSIIDFFVEQSDGVKSWGYFDDQGDNIFDINALAYYTYLINPDYQFDTGGQDLYFSFVPLVETELSETIQTRGGQYQWDIAYGGNYDDRLYYGVSLGIQTIRYDQVKEYSEFALEDSPLNSLVFTDRLSVTGTGINLTGGLIYRMNDVIRFGISGTTPTAIRLSEVYNASLTAEYNNFTYRPAEYVDDPDLQEALIDQEVSLSSETYSTIDLKAEYTLITPYRISAGLSVFAGKLFFVTADVEYVGYQNAWLTGGTNSGITFDGDNNTIDNLYTGAYNFKIGTEFRIKKLRIRGGGAYYDDPYNLQNDTFDRSTTILSGGIGVRDKDYFFDVGFVSSVGNSEYSPYNLSAGNSPLVQTKNTRTRAMFSFGVFF